jgi:glycosyltransferase involved in cell wall biosynthesis
MKLSVIVATRNRAQAIIPSLDSIVQSLSNAALSDAEIIVIDNGSTDRTGERIRSWTAATGATVQSLVEPRAGKSTAVNRGIRAARGDLLLFTDDDCRLTKNHVSDLLRHASADTEPTLRGGRVELGDVTDLPLTIQTNPHRLRWHRNDVERCAHLGGGVIPGCNMAMSRAVIDRVGQFDERLGPGTRIPSNEDVDYVYRAFLNGIIIEYVPDMAVAHWHGRKTEDAGRRLIRQYVTGTGALYAKFLLNHPNLREKLRNSTSKTERTLSDASQSRIDIPLRAKLFCAARGAVRYRLYV